MRVFWSAGVIMLLAVVVLGYSDPARADGISTHSRPEGTLHAAVRSGPSHAKPASNLPLPKLRSASALVIDQSLGTTIFAKRSDVRMPIASITKLMTAIVVLDAAQPLDQRVSITKDDLDHLRGTSSRLRVGTELTRHELLHLALMSSENRAAAALCRAYPGGTGACVKAMNRRAAELEMRSTRFEDPTGLDGRNVSTAEDLARLVRSSYRYALIRDLTTSPAYVLTSRGAAHGLQYRNTNVLVRNGSWDIGLSKTGYISEAGRCLVMQARIEDRPLIIVLLNSQGKYSGIGDANRIRKWLQSIGYGKSKTADAEEAAVDSPA